LGNGVAAACAEHNIPIVAYSPLGRGILTGAIKSLEDIPTDSMLRAYPRFQPDVLPLNLKLVSQIEEIAQKKGCTPAQLAINWTRAVQKKANATIIPIPGATTVEKVKQNAKLVELSDQDVAELDAILEGFNVLGNRYPDFVPYNG
jgi:pyridoxine 4-dehydrogenase